MPERLCSLSVVGITLRGPVRVTTSKARSELMSSAFARKGTWLADL